jgi:hypothetical protein
VSWHVEVLVLSMGLLSTSWLEAAWSIGDAMDGDGVEQLLVEALAKRSVALALDGDHRLEGRQRLDGAFEADRSRLNAVLGWPPYAYALQGNRAASEGRATRLNSKA